MGCLSFMVDSGTPVKTRTYQQSSALEFFIAIVPLKLSIRLDAREQLGVDLVVRILTHDGCRGDPEQPQGCDKTWTHLKRSNTRIKRRDERNTANERQLTNVGGQKKTVYTGERAMGYYKKEPPAIICSHHRSQAWTSDEALHATTAARSRHVCVLAPSRRHAIQRHERRKFALWTPLFRRQGPSCPAVASQDPSWVDSGLPSPAGGEKCWSTRPKTGKAMGGNKMNAPG